MSSDIVTPGDNFDLVVDRLRAALGVRTLTGVGEALGMSQSALQNRRKADSLPLAEIARLAAERGWSLDWLLLGRGAGPELRAAEPAADYHVGVDWDLLRVQISRLEAALEGVGAKLSPEAKATALATMYEMAQRGVSERAFDVFMRMLLQGPTAE